VGGALILAGIYFVTQGSDSRSIQVPE